MERPPHHDAPQAQHLWQEPEWYQALTLEERLLLSRACPDNSTSSVPENSPLLEKALQKLRAWKAQKPFDSGTVFMERLSTIEATEKILLSLLAETPETLLSRISTTPSWLIELCDVLKDLPAADDSFQSIFDRYNKTPAANILAFLSFIKWGKERLQKGIDKIASTFSCLPFDPSAVSSLFLAEFAERLLPKVAKTFVLELHVARLGGLLQGESAEERFHSFVQLLQAGRLVLLFKEYPVLARQIIIVVDQWVACGLELLERLCRDWDAIRLLFTPDVDPGHLIAIESGAGDTHRGGRSVTLLTFSSGFRLVYKPKSLTIDVHFQELLARLNQMKNSPAFRILKIVNRDNYGWCEFVHAQTCQDLDEVERFYRQQGKYLTLLYALEAIDVHYENIIAARDQPVLVDLEALFHPRFKQDNRPELVAHETLGHSVLSVGLLPQRSGMKDHTEGIDVSGLGGQVGQYTASPVPRWADAGTDQMRLIRIRAELPAGKNRPSLEGQDVDTAAFRESFIMGFTEMYHYLLAHRKELLQDWLPRFAHDEIRCIFRPTRTYAKLLGESFHPNLLRNALDRDRFFDHLWRGINWMDKLALVIPAECEDLLRGDIPFFFTTPGSYDVFTSSGQRITGLMDENSLERASRRIQTLNEEDLKWQIWIIQAAFTSLTMGKEEVVQRRIKLSAESSGKQVTKEQLLTEACKIGDRLCELAVRRDKWVNWVGVTLRKESHWMLRPADIDFYDGISGITFFLAYLGKITGNNRYTSTAQLAYTMLNHLVKQYQENSRDAQIGTFSGLGGPIYLNAHLGRLWNTHEPLREAEKIVASLPKIIEEDKAFDVVGGAAGCIASLLALYKMTSASFVLETAIACGDHLLNHAQKMQEGIGWANNLEEPPLTGFSHGNAGIALCLLRLAVVSGEERFLRAVMLALSYERSRFSSVQQNWPSFRRGLITSRVQDEELSLEDPRFYRVTWCHGAPGIGLARLESLDHLDDPLLRSEIDIAITTTLARGFGMNHSLCHGDLGNLELLLRAAQAFETGQYHEHFTTMTTKIVESIQREGWVTGIPQGVEVPGLMTGLAGTGYGLLRLAAPDQVPSVLTLSPPL